MTSDRSCAVPPVRLSFSLVEVGGESVLDHLGDLHLVYCAAFEDPPWSEGVRESSAFRSRLVAHAALPGFRCVLGLERLGGRLLGFAYGLATIDSATDPWAAPLVEVLGPDLADRYLTDSFHFAELAVRPSSRRRGLGGLLHDRTLAGAAQGRAWLATSPGATGALSLYRGRGWQPLATFVPTGWATSRSILVRQLPFSGDRLDQAVAEF